VITKHTKLVNILLMLGMSVYLFCMKKHSVAFIHLLNLWTNLIWSKQWFWFF